MKTRVGFVSNSSSTSYYITNTTDSEKSLKDFAEETKNLVGQFNAEYTAIYNFTEDGYIRSADDRHITFQPHERKIVILGDEQMDTIGHVGDYMLRDGGNSKSFRWEFNEFLR